MLIAQISDLHIAPPGEKTLGHVPMDENLKGVVAHINALEMRPDVLVVSGDITDQGDLASARYAREMLDMLKMPYYVIPGNHDSRAAILEGFEPEHCPSELTGFICYTVDDFDIRLIALDSTIPGSPGGELCPVRLNWLAQKLAEAPVTPTCIFLHHPPLKCGVSESDADGFVGDREFSALIRPYNNILRVACGHIHLVATSGWGGTPLSTAPSIGMRLRLDLTKTHPSAYFTDAPAYQLHLMTSGGHLVTHTNFMDKPAGPFAFEPINS